METKSRTTRAVSIFALLVFILSTQALAFDFKKELQQGHAVVQLGGYWSTQGKAQNIDIEGLIGDRFSVTQKNASNGLFGLGYYLAAQNKDNYSLAYGINAFYLAKTAVAGTVIQEQLFRNLSYGYHVTHYPLFAAAKAIIKPSSPMYALTLDAGIGPNFMVTGGFKEHSLDGITLPDDIFSGHTTTTLSAMVGFGVKINRVFGETPLECGYRFFYLGQGNFLKNTNQVLNTLNTGNDYANALMCSITI